MTEGDWKYSDFGFGIKEPHINLNIKSIWLVRGERRDEEIILLFFLFTSIFLFLFEFSHFIHASLYFVYSRLKCVFVCAHSTLPGTWDGQIQKTVKWIEYRNGLYIYTMLSNQDNGWEIWKAFISFRCDKCQSVYSHSITICQCYTDVRRTHLYSA